MIFDNNRLSILSVAVLNEVKLYIMKCKHCNQEISGTTHSCPVLGKTIYKEEDNSFWNSMVIGYVTDSGIIGGLLGGDIAGGILGDWLNDD